MKKNQRYSGQGLGGEDGYCSYYATALDDELIIIFNDHKANINSSETKILESLANIECVKVTVNTKTGEQKKKYFSLKMTQLLMA